MPPRKRRFDPNQMSLGFNMDTGPGSESAPAAPSASTGPSVAPGGPAKSALPPGYHPDAGAAYSAAETDLNPPRPAPRTSEPAMSGWKGMAQRALTAPAGTSPLAAMGPYGAAANLAIRGVKSAFAPNPYGNLDTKRANASSDWGQNLWMGRGMQPGIYGDPTSKKYAPANGPGRPQGRTPGGFASEYKDVYPDADSGHPGGGGMSPLAPPTTSGAPGLAPPGPAADWMHASRTSGSGNPYFDAHTAATSGMNTAPVEPIRAPESP